MRKLFNSHWKFASMMLIGLFMMSCVGVKRGCSSCLAEATGANWVVVELTEATGTPYRCWQLVNVSISNEDRSDGIYWQDRDSGNLIHISSSYDYVQVKNDKWDLALAEVNMTVESCGAVRAMRYNPLSNKYELPKYMKDSLKAKYKVPAKTKQLER